MSGVPIVTAKILWIDSTTHKQNEMSAALEVNPMIPALLLAKLAGVSIMEAIQILSLASDPAAMAALITNQAKMPPTEPTEERPVPTTPTAMQALQSTDKTAIALDLDSPLNSLATKDIDRIVREVYRQTNMPIAQARAVIRRLPESTAQALRDALDLPNTQLVFTWKDKQLTFAMQPKTNGGAPDAGDTHTE